MAAGWVHSELAKVLLTKVALEGNEGWLLPHATGMQMQDTVAVQELRFGDNHTLSAHVAVLVPPLLFATPHLDAAYVEM